MKIPAYLKLPAVAMVALTQTGAALEMPQSRSAISAISSETRAELLDARDRAWRAFFSNDPGQLKTLLGPELIAIQQHQEQWENRDRLIALASEIKKNGVKIVRLEFPRTEVQVFGDVAILYYTYIFETSNGSRSATDAGRGTEIFVRRGGRWVDVGWHIDSGAFVRRNGAWVRVSSSPEGS